MPGLTRSQAKRLVDHDRTSVDGRPPKAGTVLRGGERVEIRPFPPDDGAIEPDDIPLRLLAHDDHVIVLVKPADLVVHPAAGHARGTLVNALRHLGLTTEGGDARRPGIVHRLDRGTSGVMVVARTAQAHTNLARQFHDHSIDRLYEAIVLGEPPSEARYETFYRRHPVDRKRFTSRAAGGRKAITSFRVIGRAGGCARIEVRLGTGRTHQIRVHLSDHGFPILGDPLYGRSPHDGLSRRIAASLGRPALHARVLGFTHPGTGERVRWEASPPADFESAWSALLAADGRKA